MKEILSAIRNVLRNENKDSEELWAIFTALRGPDNSNDNVKEATTQVIRHYFLGRGPYEYGSMCGSLVSADNLASVEMRKKLAHDHTELATIHFIRHAQKAFRALGLKWNELNGPAVTYTRVDPNPGGD